MVVTLIYLRIALMLRGFNMLVVKHPKQPELELFEGNHY